MLKICCFIIERITNRIYVWSVCLAVCKNPIESSHGNRSATIVETGCKAIEGISIVRVTSGCAYTVPNTLPAAIVYDDRRSLTFAHTYIYNKC